MSAKAIVAGILGFITFTQHIANIAFILRAKELHQPVYYILVHISVAEVTYSVIAFSYVDSELHIDVYVRIVFIGLIISSLLSHLAVSFDRWVKVKNYLRYEEIVTTKRLIQFSPLLWAISFLVPLVYVHIVTGVPGTWPYDIFNVLAFPASATLIFLAFWIQRERKRVSQDSFSGVDEQRRRCMVETLDAASSDIFQPNVSVAPLMILPTILDAAWM